MDSRERRQAIQEHLRENRERAQGAFETDTPAGYEPLTVVGDSIYPLACLLCGATVGRSRALQHSLWHQKLWERIGIN